MGQIVLDRDTRISVNLLQKWNDTKINQVTKLTILAVNQ
jgi:hypothetical protein